MSLYSVKQTTKKCCTNMKCLTIHFDDDWTQTPKNVYLKFISNNSSTFKQLYGQTYAHRIDGYYDINYRFRIKAFWNLDFNSIRNVFMLNLKLQVQEKISISLEREGNKYIRIFEQISISSLYRTLYTSSGGGLEVLPPKLNTAIQKRHRTVNSNAWNSDTYVFETDG